ncbi:TonB-dependent receptor [Elongatibacter sediminis]|uniref:TonB-dependent receptor n=1 Tax=Elongatibacter sediminis TaxID=3119006 RepID=A0AAW9RH50_9GAMM
MTAQKRAQNINDVGIAISAFDAQTIRELGFQQPIDVATQTTNFSVNQLVTSIPNFTIRGVGVNDYAINQATSVGSYVDQVFIASPAMMLFQMFDTERVEVLKGPQGTLYGRNTTGGAVLFISKSPTEEPEASVDLEIGSYGYYMVEGAVSGPLSDTVRGRLAFNTTQSDGYQENIFTGEDHGGYDRVSARAILDWTPSDSVDVRLKVHVGKDNSSLNSFNVPGVGSNDSSSGTIDTIDGVPYRDNDSKGAALTIDWDLGNLVLTSVSSYDQLDRFEYGDTDGLFADGRIDQVLISDIDQFTQELRLASNGDGPVTWVGGLYYSEDEIEDGTIYEVTGAGFPPFVFGVPSSYATLDELGNTFQQKSQSAAIFGQVEWDVADRWHLTAGLRYTQEDKELNNVTTPWRVMPGPGESGPDEVGLLFPPASFDEDFDAVSGKFGADFRLNEDILFYGSISKGFKSGGFQGTLVFSPSNIIPFDEETVLAYEVGSKMTLADGRVQLNSAFFFYDYENLQAQGTIEGGAGGVENLFALQNIGDAEVLGFEIDLTAAPTERLNLALGVGYLDAEIVDPFIAEVQPDGRPAMSPKWNLNGRAQFVVHDAGSHYWFVRGDFNFQDDVFFDIYETPFLLEDSYWLFNAAVGVTSTDGRWRAEMWGRNLGDTDYRIGGFTGGVAGPVQIFGEPRTYGVSFSYLFD